MFKVKIQGEEGLYLQMRLAGSIVSVSLSRFSAGVSKGNSESLAHPALSLQCVVSAGFGLLFI